MFKFFSPNKQIEKLNDVKIVRTSKRFKTVLLRVKDGEAEILCPYFTSNRYLKSLIDKKSEWIERKINSSIQTLNKSNQISNGFIWFKGMKLKLVYIKGNYAETVLSDKTLKIFYKGTTVKSERRIIVNWLKSQSDLFLNKRLPFISKKIGIDFCSHKIKTYNARWGSCSEKGEISLNWKLIMLPVSIIDYVLIHELCHVIVQDHSSTFWNLVNKKCPNYKKKKKWLKDNGSFLIAFH